MKKTKGLWIDHRKAVIVSVTDNGEEISEVASHVERQVRGAEGPRSRPRYPAQLVPTDNLKQRHFTEHIARYYDEVIARLRDAEEVLVFGPGEAKKELAKRMEGSRTAVPIAGIETAGRMTDRQIAAKVRSYFRKERSGRALAA